MDPLTKPELEGLLAHPDQPHLSLYMPTYREGADIQQNPVRFKNLLRQAEEELCQSGGLRRPEAQTYLERAQNQLLVDESFWQHQSDGLALFMTPEFFEYYRLPLPFEETVIVGIQFYIKPLFAMFQNEGRFYVLALSQNEVRLLEGTKYQVKEVDLDQMPASLADALKWDVPEKQTQYHSVGGGQEAGGGGRPMIAFHGQGDIKDENKTNLLRFFQEVDEGLTQFLGDGRVPLILAGVEYLLPIYREASHYKFLEVQGIIGNPEGLSDEMLHAEGWALVASRFEAARIEEMARYQQLTGQQNGLASKDAKEIVQAAAYGRVEKLFIRAEKEVWGTADFAANQVEFHPDRTLHSEDLINTAALHTLQNNGAIYTLDAQEMPDVSALAAIFRY
jgi:hypothetical protein